MSTIVKEDIASREVRYQAGKLVGTCTFHVYDNASSTTLTTAQSVMTLFGTATLPDPCPKVGMTHPDVSELFGSTWSLNKVEGHTNLWSLVWNYEQNVVATPPGSVGYVEFNMSRRREFDDVWRKSPNLTIAGANGNVNNANATDIIGVPCDVGGEPVSALRYKQRFELSEVVTAFNWSDYIAIANTIGPHVGKRNQTSFYGAAPGRLLFEGAEDARVGLNKFRFTYHFIWDAWYHLVQLPARHPGGLVKLDVDRKALQVFWRQPFDELSEFNGTGGLGVHF